MYCESCIDREYILGVLERARCDSQPLLRPYLLALLFLAPFVTPEVDGVVSAALVSPGACLVERLVTLPSVGGRGGGGIAIWEAVRRGLPRPVEDEPRLSLLTTDTSGRDMVSRSVFAPPF